MSEESQAILKLGVPKGSLEDATINLFERAGWKIRKHTRNYFPDINDPEISASLCRVQEIGGYIAAGILDVGITGLDWLTEGGHEDKVVHVADLVYSKTSNRPCRWVLAVAGDSPYQCPQDLAGKRIATELEGLTRNYFKRVGVDVDVFYSWGATEAKVVEGLADGIVEVTETGTTIRAHGLRIIDEVMCSYPVIIANKDAWADPRKRAKIDQLTLLLQGRPARRKPGGHQDERPGLQPGRHPRDAALPELAHGLAPARRGLALGGDRGQHRRGARPHPRLREAGAEGIIEYAPEQGHLAGPDRKNVCGGRAPLSPMPVASFVATGTALAVRLRSLAGGKRGSLPHAPPPPNPPFGAGDIREG